MHAPQDAYDMYNLRYNPSGYPFMAQPMPNIAYPPMGNINMMDHQVPRGRPHSSMGQHGMVPYMGSYPHPSYNFDYGSQYGVALPHGSNMSMGNNQMMGNFGPMRRMNMPHMHQRMAERPIPFETPSMQSRMDYTSGYAPQDMFYNESMHQGGGRPQRDLDRQQPSHAMDSMALHEQRSGNMHPGGMHMDNRRNNATPTMRRLSMTMGGNDSYGGSHNMPSTCYPEGGQYLMRSTGPENMHHEANSDTMIMSMKSGSPFLEQHQTPMGHLYDRPESINRGDHDGDEMFHHELTK